MKVLASTKSDTCMGASLTVVLASNRLPNVCSNALRVPRSAAPSVFRLRKQTTRQIILPAAWFVACYFVFKHQFQIRDCTMWRDFFQMGDRLALAASGPCSRIYGPMAPPINLHIYCRKSWCRVSLSPSTKSLPWEHEAASHKLKLLYPEPVSSIVNL